MDNATRRRLTLGFLSNWVSRLAGTIIQLIQVPVFLHFWTVPLYGEWLIVNSIPSYLSFSNIGFGSVASNEMTMLMARNEKVAALRVFQSCWWLISAACSATILLLGVAVLTLPMAKWLRLNSLSAADTRWIIFSLGTAVLFGQLEQLLGAAYTCIGRYPYGTFIKSLITLGAFGVMIVPVLLGRGPRAAAIVFAIANVVGTVILGIMVRRDIPWIEFGWKYASWEEIRRLAPPAFAFMGFPVGQALNLQGTLLAVGYALGPTDVVIFGTARTVSRVALQMVQLVNQTFSPELGIAFGAGNIALVRTLHRRACQMAFLIGVILIAVVMTVGPWFLAHWTAHKVPPSPGLLLMLMVSVLFYAGWSTSSTLIMAINRHQVLATYYLCGTAVTVVVTFLAAKYSGLVAAACSLILSELIMNAYVLPTSLRLAEDTWSGFLRGMLQFPEALRPANLIRRIRRERSTPGDHGELEM
jgi:O-antigen/teichoic acid export membrane protein